MIFYKTTYKINQDIDIIFNYFLSKKYLTKTYGEKSDDKVTLVSKYDNDLINELDELKIITENKDSYSEIIFDKIEILKYKSIKMRMTYGVMKNKSYQFKNEEEEIDSNNILSKILPKESILNMKFYKSKSQYIVVSTIEIHKISFCKKIAYKIYGWTEQLYFMKINKLTIQEIESLK